MFIVPALHLGSIFKSCASSVPIKPHLLSELKQELMSLNGSFNSVCLLHAAGAEHQVPSSACVTGSTQMPCY